MPDDHIHSKVGCMNDILGNNSDASAKWQSIGLVSAHARPNHKTTATTRDAEADGVAGKGHEVEEISTPKTVHVPAAPIEHHAHPIVIPR